MSENHNPMLKPKVQIYCIKCGVPFTVVPHIWAGRGYEFITCPKFGCEHPHRIADLPLRSE